MKVERSKETDHDNPGENSKPFPQACGSENGVRRVARRDIAEVNT